MVRMDYRQRMSRRVTILLLATSLMVAGIGVALGALPLSAVEPAGHFVACGPALFGRPSPMPHPACGGAYAPLPWLSVGLFVAAVALAALAAIGGIALRRKRLSADLDSSRPPVSRATGRADEG